MGPNSLLVSTDSRKYLLRFATHARLLAGRTQPGSAPRRVDPRGWLPIAMPDPRGTGKTHRVSGRARQRPARRWHAPDGSILLDSRRDGPAAPHTQPAERRADRGAQVRWWDNQEQTVPPLRHALVLSAPAFPG